MPRVREKAEETGQQQVLADALAAFEETTGLHVAVLRTEGAVPGGVADAEVRIGEGAPVLVECKRTVTRANLGAVVGQIRRFGRPAVLVTRHVNQALAERLRELDVPFIDAAGNAYLRTPELLIFVTGRKPERNAPGQLPVRAFRHIGLKAIFALLCRADLVAAPYRTIAGQADVALGTVNAVMKDLERLGFLRVTKAQGRRIDRKAELQTLWVEAYLRDLRPRLNPRRYRVGDGAWWKGGTPLPPDLFLGGEPAAALLTEHLAPEVATIYDGGGFAALARRLMPNKDDHGNLEVLQRFWPFEPPEVLPGWPLAPPLLVYADLLGTADARNLETAEIVREKFLA
jgi:hypothetical protein